MARSIFSNTGFHLSLAESRFGEWERSKIYVLNLMERFIEKFDRSFRRISISWLNVARFIAYTGGTAKNSNLESGGGIERRIAISKRQRVSFQPNRNQVKAILLPKVTLITAISPRSISIINSNVLNHPRSTRIPVPGNTNTVKN